MLLITRNLARFSSAFSISSSLPADYLDRVSVPALTHEDPRYFTLGYGGTFRRAAYADLGQQGGQRALGIQLVRGRRERSRSDFIEGLLPNRGFGQTFRNWGVQVEAARAFPSKVKRGDQ
jgi:hypothetical protein